MNDAVPTVWIVDDGVLEGEMLRRALEGDHDVVLFTGGAPVLSRLECGSRPDLLLVDWMLKEGNAEELCRTVRARFDELELPILVVTTSPEAVAVEALDAGANDFVRKTQHFVELRARVRSLLRTRQLSARLAEVEAQRRFIIDAFEHILWTVTPHGVIDYINRPAQDYFGITAADVRFGAWEALVHPDDRAAAEALWHEALATGTSSQRRVRLQSKDGADRWFLLRIGSQRDELGQVVRWVGTATDIDEQERLAAQLEGIFEHTPVGISLLDKDLRFVRVNRALAAMNGAPVNVHIGRTIFDVVPGIAPKLAETYMRTLRGEDSGCTVEVSGRTLADPGVEHVWLCAHHAIAIGGQTIGLVATSTDITDRKRAESALDLLAKAGVALTASLDVDATVQRVTELVVPVFADACSVYLSGSDGSLRLVAASHVAPERAALLRELAERYPLGHDVPFGYPHVIRTGQPELVAVVDDDMRRAVARDEAHLALLRELYARSIIVVPLTAHERTFGAIVMAISESDRQYGADDLRLAKELARRVAVATDNARLFQLANAERRRAEEASRAKDEFLAMVSHELRSPLSAIVGWAAMLRHGSLPAEHQTRALDAIERSAHAQATLIDQLLDLSRIVTGTFQLNLQPVSLAQLVQLAVDSYGPLAQAKGLDLRTSLDPAVGIVTADPDRLQQVVSNIVSNAVKFTPATGLVQVRLQRTDTAIELVVQDTGQGIAPEFLPHVFERFRQAESGTTRAKPGLGLGLAIVKHIVELHGGTVAAHSDGVGRGASFVVRLPLETMRPKRPTLNPPPASLQCPAELKDIRILIVDDEAEARELLGNVLGACAAVVRTASSAAEGLAMVREWRPDLLLSDISMPIEDGYTLVERLRALPADEGGLTPAVALTAYARGEDRLRALLAGFNAHLSKPVNPAELVLVLARLVGATRSRKVARRAPG